MQASDNSEPGNHLRSNTRINRAPFFHADRIWSVRVNQDTHVETCVDFDRVHVLYRKDDLSC